MPKISLHIDKDVKKSGFEFIKAFLERCGFGKSALSDALRMSETAIAALSQNAAENAELQISVKHWLKTAEIIISAEGEKVDLSRFNEDIGLNNIGNNAEEEIRAILASMDSEKIQYSRKRATNFVKINVGSEKQIFAIRSAAAFIASIIVAFLCYSFLPVEVMDSVSKYVLMPIQTLFLNALKLVTAPAVFFALVTCMAKYASIADSDSINIKIIFTYIVFAVISVAVGIGVSVFFDPTLGYEGILSALVDKNAVTNADNPIMNTIINAVPTNIVDPFLKNDSIQLLVVAVLSGIALGRAGKYSFALRDRLNALNKFFSACVDIVTDLIPIGVFFATLLMITKFGFAAVISSVTVFVLTIVGFLIITLIMMLYVKICGGLNPFVFLRKFMPGIIKTFITGSGTGVANDTMKLCKSRLGISPRVYAFSIPFGAIGNLNGNCIYLTVAGFIIAKLCGVSLINGGLFTIIFMIVILSVGSPITPGSAMLALTMLMEQMGISLQVISIFLGLNALIEVILAVFNTVGDVAISLVRAKKENLLDIDMYYSEY